MHLAPTRQTGPVTESIALARDQLLVLHATRGTVRLAHGHAWLTEAGHPRDRFLAAGDLWRLEGRPVLIEALSAAELHLQRDAGRRTPAALLARGGLAAVAAARRFVTRMQFGAAAGSSA